VLVRSNQEISSLKQKLVLSLHKTEIIVRIVQSSESKNLIIFSFIFIFLDPFSFTLTPVSFL